MERRLQEDDAAGDVQADQTRLGARRSASAGGRDSIPRLLAIVAAERSALRESAVRSTSHERQRPHAVHTQAVRNVEVHRQSVSRTERSGHSTRGNDKSGWTSHATQAASARSLRLDYGDEIARHVIEIFCKSCAGIGCGDRVVIPHTLASASSGGGPARSVKIPACALAGGRVTESCGRLVAREAGARCPRGRLARIPANREQKNRRANARESHLEASRRRVDHSPCSLVLYRSVSRKLGFRHPRRRCAR